MANKVSFIIQLKDKFGRTARKIGRQFAGIQKSADKANRSITQFAKKGQASLQRFSRKAAKTGAIMTAGLTAPILLLSRSMIRAASDAEETANKFNQVFDDVGGRANKVADDFSKNFGVAGSTARKMIGDTGDLLSGFGFAGDAALEMSKKVAILSSDLASFANIQGGATDVSQRITKALLGETESLGVLGVKILQNTKEFRREVKIKSRSLRISVQQAKALVILNEITRQSAKSVGDVSRTWNDYANVVRRSEEANKDLREGFGKILLPLATKLTLALTDLVNWVGNLSRPMKVITLSIAAFVAVLGPALLLLSGVAFVLGALSLPIILITAGIVGLGVALAAFAMNFDSIVLFVSDGFTAIANVASNVGALISAVFSDVWGGLASGFMSFVNMAIGRMNTLLTPLNFVIEKLGGTGFKIESIRAPIAPSANMNASLNGQITVSASPGTQVRQTSMVSSGNGLNIGMNMVTQ